MGTTCNTETNSLDLVQVVVCVHGSSNTTRNFCYVFDFRHRRKRARLKITNKHDVDMLSWSTHLELLALLHAIQHPKLFMQFAIRIHVAEVSLSPLDTSSLRDVLLYCFS